MNTYPIVTEGGITIPHMDEAGTYKEKADAAYNAQDYSAAFGHYCKAAELFELGGDVAYGKYLRGRAWYSKARMMDPKSIEDHRMRAEYHDNAARATNIALDLMDTSHSNYDIASESLRLYETRRFSDLADAEELRAEKISGDAEGRADHLWRAALFRRSLAFAMELAAEVSRDSGSEFMYDYQIGGHHHERARYHHFLARSHRTLKNLREALDENERSRKECEKSVRFYEKALKNRPGEKREAELEEVRSFLVKRLGDIGDLRSELPHHKDGEGKEMTADKPRLDVKVIPLRGMTQNLITTISVRLTNSGTAEATKIRIKLYSPDMEGDTRARIERLSPGRNVRVGLSLIPYNAGNLPVKFDVKYRGPKGRRIKLVENTSVMVGRPREKRPEGTMVVELRGENALLIDPDRET